MPKDATKNIDRYKVRGGELNEFDFHQNQEEFVERRTQATSLIPGTPPEAKAERLKTLTKKAAKATKKAATTKKVSKRTKAAPARREGAEKRAAKKAGKKTAKRATKKTAKKAAKKK